MYTKGPNGGCSGASDRATDGCPYRDFSMYYDYYGDFDYADKLVLAAITKSSANMDFAGKADSLRKECIKKATAYMNAYMYAIREFEDAIDDCHAGCTNGIVGSQGGVDCNSLSMTSEQNCALSMSWQKASPLKSEWELAKDSASAKNSQLPDRNSSLQMVAIDSSV